MESLYRKYRPQTFADVVGQQHVVSTLEHAVTEGKTSHAYLFCGPRGTGKTTMARILAKALMCAQGPGHLPDGTCEECQLIASGDHPDVYELDAASRTGVDNVREEIISRVDYAPVRGRYKVYIIDEVHMLTTAAFNALLKTLEEPPAHVVFVMCTTDPQKVPATILSRVQRFDFHAIASDEMRAHLADVCQREGFTYEDEALDLVCRHARGGMRDAISTLEQLSVFGDGQVTAPAARDLLGEVAGSTLQTVSAALAARDVPALFGEVATLVEGGRDLLQFTRELAGHVRDIYVVSVAGMRGDVVAATDAERAELAREAQAYGGPDRLVRVLTVLGDAANEMRLATNQRLVLELAFARLARPDSELTLEALAERIERLERALAQGGAPAAATRTEPAPAAARPSASPTVAAPAARAQVDAPAAAPALKAQPAPAQHASAPAAPAPAGGTSAPAASATRLAAPRREVASSQGAATGAAPAAPARPAAPRPATTSTASPKPSPAPARPAPAPRAAAPASPAAAPAPDAAPHMASAPQAPEAPAVSAGALDAGAVQRTWKLVVSELVKTNPSFGSLLLSSQATADDGETVTVTLPKGSSFAFRMLERPDVKAAVDGALARQLPGRRVSFVESSMAGAAASRATASAAPAAPAPAQAAPAPAVVPKAQPAPEPKAPAAPAPAPKPSAVPAPSAAPARHDASKPAPRPAAPAPAVPAPAPDDDFVPYSDADVYLGDEEFDAQSQPQPPAAPAAPSPSAAPARPTAPAAPAPGAPQTDEAFMEMFSDVFGRVTAHPVDPGTDFPSPQR